MGPLFETTYLVLINADAFQPEVCFGLTHPSLPLKFQPEMFSHFPVWKEKNKLFLNVKIS